MAAPTWLLAALAVTVARPASVDRRRPPGPAGGTTGGTAVVTVMIASVGA
jgi:hypothetical protein